MTANQQRIEQHIELLSQFTATPGEGVTRLTYSQEDLQARNYIKEKNDRIWSHSNGRWLWKYLRQA